MVSVALPLTITLNDYLTQVPSQLFIVKMQPFQINCCRERERGGEGGVNTFMSLINIISTFHYSLFLSYCYCYSYSACIKYLKLLEGRVK